jgi:hypothetical protein
MRCEEFYASISIVFRKYLSCNKYNWMFVYMYLMVHTLHSCSIKIRLIDLYLTNKHGSFGKIQAKAYHGVEWLSTGFDQILPWCWFGLCGYPLGLIITYKRANERKQARRNHSIQHIRLIRKGGRRSPCASYFLNMYSVCIHFQRI